MNNKTTNFILYIELRSRYYNIIIIKDNAKYLLQ